MNDAFYVAATGLTAHQLHLDTISNNLANAATPGFKKSRVTMQDLVTQELTRQSNPSTDVETQPLWGSGAGVAALLGGRTFAPGELRQTNGVMDLAIRGPGFFEVVLPDGSVGLTRGGTLQIGKDGQLTDAGGRPLKSTVVLRQDGKDVRFLADGRVMAVLGSAASHSEIGRIELVDFTNPEGLLALGDGLYQASERSGDSIVVKAGAAGAGTFAQGFIEGSNVNLVEEMMGLMLAQRSYGISAKVVQAADELMGLVNNLRK